MSNECTNFLNAQENPEAQEPGLDDEMIVKFFENNLAKVLSDTAQKQAELEKDEEEKRKLIDLHYKSFKIASKKDAPKKKKLMPCLDQVSSKAEDLVGEFRKLIDAKATLVVAYDEHCKEAKGFTAVNFDSNYDQYTSMSDAKLGKLIGKTKNVLKETLAKTTVTKAELVSKKKESRAKNSAMMREIKTLTQVEQDAVERLDQLRLEDVLNK